MATFADDKQANTKRYISHTHTHTHTHTHAHARAHAHKQRTQYFRGKVQAITAKLDLGTAEQSRQRQRQSPS
jgi:hypothetical protein